MVALTPITDPKETRVSVPAAKEHTVCTLTADMTAGAVLVQVFASFDGGLSYTLVSEAGGSGAQFHCSQDILFSHFSKLGYPTHVKVVTTPIGSSAAITDAAEVK